jgi:hypothetical protein
MLLKVSVMGFYCARSVGRLPGTRYIPVDSSRGFALAKLAPEISVSLGTGDHEPRRRVNTIHHGLMVAGGTHSTNIGTV